MKSLVIGSVCGVVIALCMVFMAKSIANDCRESGAFQVDDELFECRLKEKHDEKT